jgi:hypothetical protein
MVLRRTVFLASPGGRGIPLAAGAILVAARHTTNPEARDFYVRLEEQTCVPIPHSIRGRSTSPHWYLSLLPTEPTKLLITGPFISLLPASCGQSLALPNLFPRAITDGDLQLR